MKRQQQKRQKKSKKVAKKETEKKKEKEEEEEKTKEEEPAIDGGSVEATCSLTLSSEQFVTAQTGSKKRVNCPVGCAGQDAAGVFGPSPADDKLQINKAYDDKSSLCRSAIHSGIIKDTEGGDIYAFVVNGRDSQPKSNQNGINSASSGATPRAFQLEKAPPLLKISCNDTVYNHGKFFAQPREKFAVQCPSECFSVVEATNMKVWGNPIGG